jgi:L-lysine exporter family protein LysE/ArgO
MSASTVITTALGGLLFSFSLTIAIGPQNAFIMRQGIEGSHVATIVALCAGSDAVLITAGVAGVGAMLVAQHWLLLVLRPAGAALLLAYSALAARRAFQRTNSGLGPSRTGSSRGSTIAACLGFTWLNPSVYLDTIVLVGSVANAHPAGRWWFTAGAILASLAWFAALGYGSRLLAPLFKRPGAERLLDGFVAATMALAALRLFLGS